MMPIRPLQKLIVADDDEDTLTIAKYCLEDLKGVEVRYLSSGEEVIKEAMTFAPDMILLDVMMPKMDGIATLQAIKLIPRLANIPIVFFTAKVQKSELAKFIELGAFDIVVKPFDPLTLADTVRALWNKSQETK